MQYAFRLPDIGEGMSEAEVLRWLVRPGDRVRADQPVAECQTDKAVIEIPCPVEGVIRSLEVAEGEVVRVGAALFTIETEAPVPRGGALVPLAALTPPGPEPRRDAGQNDGAAEGGRDAEGGREVPLAAPAVRRRARELGIDLADRRGSGPGSRVLLADVERWAAESTAAGGPAARVETAGKVRTGAPAVNEGRQRDTAGLPPGAGEGIQPEEVERIPLRGLRRVIAARMEEAAAVPAFTALDEADVTELVTIRRRLAERAREQGFNLTYLPFVIKACCLAAREYPSVNAHFDGRSRELVRFWRMHVGVATATEEGLVVPVVRDAQDRTLSELAAEIDRLAAGARARQLGREELTGSTFSVTNFGALGGMSGTPILNVPEVAILGTGRIVTLPRFVEGRVAERQIMPLALTVDHRVIDGDVAAGFLGRVRAYLEDPALLLAALR